MGRGLDLISSARRILRPDEMADPKTHVKNLSGVRALAVLGDSVTTDHISPAGNIAVDSPAGKYLISARSASSRLDFNSYMARAAAITR